MQVTVLFHVLHEQIMLTVSICNAVFHSTTETQLRCIDGNQRRRWEYTWRVHMLPINFLSTITTIYLCAVAVSAFNSAINLFVSLNFMCKWFSCVSKPLYLCIAIHNNNPLWVYLGSISWLFYFEYLVSARQC